MKNIYGDKNMGFRKVKCSSCKKETTSYSKVNGEIICNDCLNKSAAFYLRRHL